MESQPWVTDVSEEDALRVDLVGSVARYMGERIGEIIDTGPYSSVLVLAPDGESRLYRNPITGEIEGRLWLLWKHRAVQRQPERSDWLERWRS